MSEVIKISDRTYRIEDGMVRFFLLEGDKEALMVDSGMTTVNALEIAKGITELPIRLLNTHSDGDHIAGNDAFDEIMMGENEITNYLKRGKKESKLLPVKNGDIIDLGNRRLEVVDLPGHTPGSVALLDIDSRFLIGGDAISDSNIYMFGEARNIFAYIDSLSKLWENYRDRFDIVYPSHGTFPVKPELIPKLINAACDIRDGKSVGRPIDLFGHSVAVHEFGFAGFYFDK